MADLQAILRLEVPIVVLVGSTELPMEAVLSLAPGAIIELPKQAEEELELLVNNKTIGSGEAFKVGEKFALKLNAVGDVAERLEAMGPSTVAKGVTPPEGAVSHSEAEALADELLAGQ